MTLVVPARDQVLTSARQLAPRDRAWLITCLVQELAEVPTPPPATPPLTPDQARAAWADLRAALDALPTPRPSLGEQIEADRRDRDHAVCGQAWEGAHVDA